MVIEILSPFTAAKDYREKLALYEKNKVKEYWIVHPTDKIVTVNLLQKNGIYGKAKIYSKEEDIKVKIFKDDLAISLKIVFRD
jgi:Uma2 family endonuclease